MKSTVTKEFVAGIFLIICSAILIVMAFTLGTREGILQKRVELRVMFDDISGLRKGNSVTLLGVHVGSVSDIQVVKDEEVYRVLVALSVYDTYLNKMRKDAVFTINVDGLMGPKTVSIDPGVGTLPIDPNLVQTGTPPIDLENLAKGAEEALASLTSTLEAAEADLEDLHYISKTLKRVIDRLEEKIIRGELFKVF